MVGHNFVIHETAATVLANAKSLSAEIDDTACCPRVTAS
jgi:hypothetical protein